jgi:hypothetical protein
MMFASAFCFNSLSGMIEASTLADAVSCAPSWGVFVSGALFLFSSITNLIVSLQPVNLPEDEPSVEAAEEEKETADEDNGGYASIKIPWSFTVTYSCGFVEQMTKESYNPQTSAYKLKFTNNLTFSGSIQPTDKWRMNFSGSVDLNLWKITSTNLSIYRDLHCWSLSASVSPFGLRKSFMVTIGVNATMLRDLKYDKRSGRSANINWLDKKR